MIDRELVTRKMVLIAEDLRRLETLAAKEREEYLASEIDETLAERYLERMIGRMIDVNYHLLTESGEAPPRDYFESFVALSRIGACLRTSRRASRRAPACATASCMRTTTSTPDASTTRCARRSATCPRTSARSAGSSTRPSPEAHQPATPNAARDYDTLSSSQSRYGGWPDSIGSATSSGTS